MPPHPPSRDPSPPHVPPTITPTQRSAQARAKPYYALLGSGETYERTRRREEAVQILESVEMLVWYSGVRNESLQQTRTHFTNLVLGLSPSSPSPSNPSNPPTTTQSHHAFPPDSTLTHPYSHLLPLSYPSPTPHTLWREEYEVPPHQRVRRDDDDAGTGSGVGSPARGGGGGRKGKEREKEKGKKKGGSGSGIGIGIGGGIGGSGGGGGS